MIAIIIIIVNVLDLVILFILKQYISTILVYHN